jgi:hypothetical protein
VRGTRRRTEQEVLVARSRACLACALTVQLLLGACTSASSFATNLQLDVAAADAALAGAQGVGVVLRFEDRDGALVRALQDDGDGMPAELAEILVGSRIAVQVAARDGRTITELPEAGVALPEQLRWYDSAVSVTTQAGDLLAYRTVDGTAYITADPDGLDRVAGAAGEQVTLADDLPAAPAAIRQAYDDVGAGEWLRLPAEELLSTTGGLQAGPPALPGGLSTTLVDSLSAAVRPHVQLSDLGNEDGVRRVTVEVDIKALLTSAAEAIGVGPSEGEPAAQGVSDALDGLTDESLQGRLTIEDGHYRRLEVPLAGLVELSAGRSADPPDLGDSSLVLELDDAVDSVPVPSRVSDVDLPALLEEMLADVSAPDAQVVDPDVGEALADVLGPRGEALDPEDGQLSAEVEALLACYDEATTQAELAACDATG